MRFHRECGNVFKAIDEGVLAGNARLKEQAALYDNIHVVALKARERPAVSGASRG